MKYRSRSKNEGKYHLTMVLGQLFSLLFLCMVAPAWYKEIVLYQRIVFNEKVCKNYFYSGFIVAQWKKEM